MDVARLKSEVIDLLARKKCWYVSCGGAAAATFQLALGKKLRRAMPTPSPKNAADEFDEFEGEANLLVWCSWRLDSPGAPVASSDDSGEHVSQSLQRLVGQVTEDVSIDLPGWDVTLRFTGGLVLRVFCDHVHDPSFDGNWDLFAGDRVISAGPASQAAVEPRNA